jgi:Copper type II ascorbate-dependent monooxygenase, C-terminal domain
VKNFHPTDAAPVGARTLRRAQRGVGAIVLALGASVLAAACGDDETAPASPDAGGFVPGPGNGVLPVGADGGFGGGTLTDAGASTGGGTTGGGNTGGGTDSAWCKAKAVIDTRCTSCHDGKGTAGTPYGLTSYADLTKDAAGFPGKKVYERVGVRIHGDKAQAEGKTPMPPQNNMTAEQVGAIDTWIAGGAQQGADPTCTSTAGATDGGVSNNGRPPSIWDPSICDAIYTIKANDGAGGKYKVPYSASAPDQYGKIYFDAPWGSETVQIINQRPITDNAKVLHHWILYDVAGPFITGWAPGDNERQPLPDNVGMKVPSGAGSMYLDMHWYNTTGAPAEDASGVELCVVKGANLRPNSSTITMGFSSLAISIPPQATNHSIKGSCTVQAQQPIHLMTASPHAHKLARHMKFSITKKNGSVVTMLDSPFTFGEQASYPLEPEVIVENGDIINTECIYSNPGNATVTFGEKNGDEMCFNFASYWPAGGFCCTGLNFFQPCGGGGYNGSLSGIFGN